MSRARNADDGYQNPSSSSSDRQRRSAGRGEVRRFERMRTRAAASIGKRSGIRVSPKSHGRTKISAATTHSLDAKARTSATDRWFAWESMIRVVQRDPSVPKNPIRNICSATKNREHRARACDRGDPEPISLKHACEWRSAKRRTRRRRWLSRSSLSANRQTAAFTVTSVAQQNGERIEGNQ